MKVLATPKQARRLMRSLDLPRQAPKVLTEARFWSEAFCRLYFERCAQEIQRSPTDSLEMAKIGVTLASRVKAEHCSGKLADLRARSRGQLAAAHRATGTFREAARCYEDAVSTKGISPFEETWLRMGLATLRLFEGRTSEALQLSSDVVSWFRRHEVADQLGIALAVRGGVHQYLDQLREAVRDYTEALELLHPKKNERAYKSNVFNLAVCLCHCDELRELSSTLRRLNQARKLIRADRNSLPRLWLRWLEGLIQGRLGLDGRALLDLRAARDGFVELRLPYETAMVSLDLSLVYLRDGRWSELRELAGETHGILRSLGIRREANAALRLWVEAVREGALDREIVTTVRQRLGQSTAAAAQPASAP